MTSSASYIPPHDDDMPAALDWNPEFSRRARGLPLYAALRSLGRAGLTRMIDNACDEAEGMAMLLSRADGVEVLNDVVLNQVLVRFDDQDEITDAVIDRVQQDGTCWMGGTTFRGPKAMRISVVGWQTTADDVELSAHSILDSFREVRNRPGVHS